MQLMLQNLQLLRGLMTWETATGIINAWAEQFSPELQYLAPGTQ